MQLVVHEIKADGVSQQVVPTRTMLLSAIRPHIYKHGSPTGSLIVQVCATDGTVIAESDPLTISSISTATYFHGYVRFDVKASLRRNASYLIKVMSGDGYSFSESAYCGVCSDFDLNKYTKQYTPTGYNDDPLDLEFWELKYK